MLAHSVHGGIQALSENGQPGLVERWVAGWGVDVYKENQTMFFVYVEPFPSDSDAIDNELYCLAVVEARV
jgi:hypothetical protein